MSRITLLTDFGTADGYVGAMKGVIASIAPEAAVDDISHEISPGDVPAAAHVLARYWSLYPPGTVHIVVVDPGVGSSRRAIVVQAEGRIIVAPDNGVVSAVLARTNAAVIHAIEARAAMRDSMSGTFHGRDVFAPCAAHLAGGFPLFDVGPRIDDPVKLLLPAAVAEPDGMYGCVVYIDRFGNLITNIPVDLARGTVVYLEEQLVGDVRRSYADVISGQAVAVIGSDDFLEIAVRDGSAAEKLGASVGAAVCARMGA